MNLRILVLLPVLLVLTASVGYGQKAMGRSAPGPLTTGMSDSMDVAVRGATAGNVDFELQFSEPSGNEYLEAKETGRLRVEIRNPGSVSVKGVYVRLNPLQEIKGVTYPDSIFVGEIPVNSSRYAIFYFQAAEKLDPQIVTIGVEVRVGRGLLADPKLLTFLTRQR